MGGVAKFLGLGTPTRQAKIITPTAVPTRRSADIQAERRKKTRKLAEAGTGREGTILTGDPAPTYVNTLLGPQS